MRIGKKLQLKKRFSTIQGRIVVLYGLLFLVAFIFINIAVNKLTGNFLTTARIDSQVPKVESIATHLAAAAANGDAEELYTRVLSSSNEIGGRVLVLDGDGIVMMDSYATLNGRLLRYREVEDIKNNSLTVSYGFHKVEEKKDSLFDSGQRADQRRSGAANAADGPAFKHRPVLCFAGGHGACGYEFGRPNAECDAK